MKQLLYFTSVLILFVGPVKSPAQINHFIYLQTENKQPFYLKMEKKILNSTVSGYLIIPKLRDSIYHFSVGFLNNENKEYDFSCSINDKDAGYIIKNFTDKGWGLFNLQTLQVIMSGAKKEDIAQPNKTDAFSNLLSIVVNDPAIQQTGPALNNEKQESKSASATAEVSEAKTEQKVSLEANSKAAPAEKKSPVPAADQAIIPNRIVKQDVVSNTEGLHITYVDFVDGRQDTIKLVIPGEKENTTNLSKHENSKEQGINLSTDQKEMMDTAAVINREANQVSKSASAQKEGDKKFLDIDMSKTTHENLDSNQAKEAVKTSTNASLNASMNAACKNIALEEDFLKLRKKMASGRNEEEMMSVAKKAFKAKCFTTDQIKNLGTLFLNDQGRYNFFDSAYPFASDPQSYKMLENQLIDEYYKSRFKAMIQH